MIPYSGDIEGARLASGLFAAAGVPLTPDQTKGAIDRALQRRAAKTGTPSPDEQSFIHKRMIPLILQTAASAVPAVPAVVRPSLYKEMDAMLPSLV